MNRVHWLILAGFFTLALLTGCTTTQRDAAGKALVSIGTKLATDAFTVWLESELDSHGLSK